MKRKYLFVIIFIIVLIGALFVLYRYNYIPHRKYDNEDFGIEPYQSHMDQDMDGMDDQTDILQNAREYIALKPKYKSKYYETGYPNDEYGVCTDVVGYALLHSGYDLQTLVNEDIKKNPEDYNVEEADINIDFRRVRNLQVYFKHTAITLTTDVKDIEQWQGGDIVIFEHHIGIVSDKRNCKGVPFVIHHANPIQSSYEEDVLEIYGEIVGHYRIS